MTGLELIIGALAAGATTGISQAAGSAVSDAAAALRRLIAQRLAGRNDALTALESLASDAETDQGVWRARLGSDLAGTGADNDQSILAAAKRVTILLDAASTRSNDLRGAQGVQTGSFSSQINYF